MDELMVSPPRQFYVWKSRIGVSALPEKCEGSRMDEETQSNVTNDSNAAKPFNDAMDHLHHIEGYPIKRPAKMNKLPLPVRLIGYFMAGFCNHHGYPSCCI